MRLLTIEDDRSVRESIAAYFVDSGFIVDQAEDGVQGLDLFRRNQPNVVLVDLHLPDINGMEVIKLIKEESPDTPAIVVSGSGVMADVIQAIRFGAWDYVTKPICEMAVLDHIVTKALDRARLIRQNHAYQEHLQEEVQRQTSEIEYLYETTPIGLGLCDEEQRFVRVNEKLAMIGGQPPKAFIGKRIREALPLLADTLEAIHRRVLDSEKAELEIEAHDMLDAEPNVARDWLISGHPVIHSGGFRGVGIVVQDITDRKRQEQERLRLERILQQAQKMEVVGTLAAGIAHDFNNMLAAIWGYVSLADNSLPPDHSAHRYLDVVDGAIEDASGIASSLLTFSRKTAVSMSQLELVKVVQDSMKLLRHTLPASIELEEHLDSAQPVYVCADVGLLHQALMNLIGNARDAMPEGGVLRVSLSQEPGGSPDDATAGQADSPPSALVVVEDTGIGMSEEVLSHIFEPFFTTKDRGRGTGLGMAMVYGIVQELAGRIVVESQPGCGTRVSIRIPCCSTPEEALEDEQDRAKECIGHGERVLLAEDDQRVRTFVATALTEVGYKVTAASRGDEAISVFHSAPNDFDLAVFDLDLPGASGSHCAEMLHRERVDMPVIILTGNVDLSITEDDPLQHVLRKPFKLSKLKLLVKQTLAETASGTTGHDHPGSEAA